MSEIRVLVEFFYGSIFTWNHVLCSGFEVKFSSEDDAWEAVKRLEDGQLDEAIRERVSARLLLPSEYDASVVQRMEREIWIYPKSYEKPHEKVIERVVLWQSLRLCPQQDEFSRECTCSLISMPCFLE